MHRDDGIVGLQRVRPVGAFGQRQAKQQGIGEKAAKPDNYGVLPIPPEQEPRPRRPQVNPTSAPA